MSGIQDVTTCVGPMMAGKSDWLISKCLEAKTQNRPVLAVRPAIDTRLMRPVIASRANPAEVPCYLAKDSAELMVLFHMLSKPGGLVAIDEAQMFDLGVVESLQTIRRSSEVVVAGVNLNYRAEPFGSIDKILGLSNKIIALEAICSICDQPATFSQRLRYGQPEKAFMPDIVIEDGGSEFVTYEPRCTLHYQEPPDMASWRFHRQFYNPKPF